ncbi:response regulator [Peristeroidobacter soli]|jgi:CheY-like chemotaxis protein|uniref:response regulator n=1 Tax=Peristeroidobacter soli TaxID=2497877 RepID=UPI0013009B45|nr:response regulator [Peristeroidobacter soli]
MLQATTPAVSDSALVRALNPGAGTELTSPLVLIIDDDATARLALAAMLGGDGHRIAFATSASEVCNRLSAIDPDIIICDLMMDEMRGDEFFRWLKSEEKWQRVPVIAVTRLDSSIVRADLLDSGADIVLSKNIAPRELRAYVAAALRTRRMYAQVVAS